MPYDNEYNRMISRDIDYFNRKYVVHSDATGQGTVDYRSQMSDMSRIGGGAGCAEYTMGTANKKGGAILGLQDGTVLGGPRVRTVSHRTEASFSSLGAPLQPPSGVVINSGNAQPYRDLGAMMNQTVNDVKAEIQQKIGAGGTPKMKDSEAKAYVEKVMKSERKKLTKGLDSEMKATAKKEGQSAGREYGSIYGKQEATAAVNAEVNKVKKGGMHDERIIGGKKKKKAPGGLFGKKKAPKKKAPPKKKGPTPQQQQQAAAKKKNAEAKKKLAEAKKKNLQAQKERDAAKKKLDAKKKKKKSLYDKAKGHAGDVAGAYGEALKDIAIRYGTRYMEDMAENAYDNFIGGPDDSDSEFSDGSSHDGYNGRRRNRGDGDHNECPPCKDPYNTLAQGADYEDDGEEGGVTKRDSYFSGKTGKGRKVSGKKKKKQTGAGMITAVNALNGPSPGPKEKAQMYSSTLSGLGKPKKTNERAKIVKQIMNEKGLSMIQASKFVKENGLY